MDVTTNRADQFARMPENRLAVWSNFGKWDTEWFPKFMGIEVEALRLDYARMRMKYHPHLQQPAGVVHGGVIATMVDTCVVPALGSGYDEPRQLFTIDISLRFLAPIIQEDIVAEGWIVQRGRSIVFCEAEVRGGTSDTLAATASLTYKVSSKPLVME
jgi:uncharacterized protein (TIGR00369 family)